MRAEVDDHRLVSLDRPCTRVVVRAGGVRAGGNHRREGGLVRAGLAERAGHVGLGSADERLGGEALVDGVRDGRRRADRVEFVVVLHASKPLEHRGPGRSSTPLEESASKAAYDTCVASNPTGGSASASSLDARKDASSRSAATTSTPSTALAASR